METFMIVWFALGVPAAILQYGFMFGCLVDEFPMMPDDHWHVCLFNAIITLLTPPCIIVGIIIWLGRDRCKLRWLPRKHGMTQGKLMHALATAQYLGNGRMRFAYARQRNMPLTFNKVAVVGAHLLDDRDCIVWNKGSWDHVEDMECIGYWERRGQKLKFRPSDRFNWRNVP